MDKLVRGVHLFNLNPLSEANLTLKYITNIIRACLYTRFSSKRHVATIMKISERTFV